MSTEQPPSHSSSCAASRRASAPCRRSSDVDFDVYAGEVMALVGDNGAGKSTLIKCIAGIHPIDEGEVFFDGRPVTIHGPKDAARLGHRGRLPGPRALRQPRRRPEHVPRPRARTTALRRLDEADDGEARQRRRWPALSVTTIRSIRQKVARLSGGQRQSVAVARAVMWNSRLVILDEPTAALGVAQTRQVLELVKRLAEQGLAVVLISHNLHDIFEVADRITVLRLGRNVASLRTRGRRPSRQVVHAITAGVPTKVAGIAAPTSRPRSSSMATGIPAARRGRRPSRRPSRSARRCGAGGRHPRRRRRQPADHRSASSLIAIFFQAKNDNFLTAGNFINLIVQMAGSTMIAIGVVFVLLLGEIDLSIGYVSGVGGVVIAELLLDRDRPRRGAVLGDLHRHRGRAPAIGLVQGLFVVKIGVPSFVVTLAGLLAWQGVLLLVIGSGGTIVIQNQTILDVANYFFATGGWLIAGDRRPSRTPARGSRVRAALAQGAPVGSPVIFGITTRARRGP